MSQPVRCTAPLWIQFIITRLKAAEIEARMKAMEDAKAREREKVEAGKQQTETQVEYPYI